MLKNRFFYSIKASFVFLKVQWNTWVISEFNDINHITWCIRGHSVWIYRNWELSIYLETLKTLAEYEITIRLRMPAAGMWLPQMWLSQFLNFSFCCRSAGLKMWRFPSRGRDSYPDQHNHTELSFMALIHLKIATASLTTSEASLLLLYTLSRRIFNLTHFIGCLYRQMYIVWVFVSNHGEVVIIVWKLHFCFCIFIMSLS